MIGAKDGACCHGAEAAAHRHDEEGYHDEVAQDREVKAQPVVEDGEDVPHTQRPFGRYEQEEAPFEGEEARHDYEGEASEVKESGAHRATSKS